MADDESIHSVMDFQRLIQQAREEAEEDEDEDGNEEEEEEEPETDAENEDGVTAAELTSFANTDPNASPAWSRLRDSGPGPCSFLTVGQVVKMGKPKSRPQ